MTTRKQAKKDARQTIANDIKYELKRIKKEYKKHLKKELEKTDITPYIEFFKEENTDHLLDFDIENPPKGMKEGYRKKQNRMIREVLRDIQEKNEKESEKNEKITNYQANENTERGC